MQDHKLISKGVGKQKKHATCIIVDTKGSTPRKTGCKMTVFENGEIKGTLGGGNFEKKVIENALKQIALDEPKLFHHELLREHGMCCGGSIKVYIEPEKVKKQLFIFGAGHTGKALAQNADKVDFDVFLIDDRKEQLSALKNESINKLHMQHGQILPFLPFNEHSFIVVMTYDHGFDREILSHCINQPHAYLGMIGSERKIALTKKLFREGMVATEEQLEKVDMPMGIDIRAEGPEEIAISVLAKLIQVRNQYKNNEISNNNRRSQRNRKSHC